MDALVEISKAFRCFCDSKRTHPPCKNCLQSKFPKRFDAFAISGAHRHRPPPLLVEISKAFRCFCDSLRDRGFRITVFVEISKAFRFFCDGKTHCPCNSGRLSGGFRAVLLLLFFLAHFPCVFAGDFFLSLERSLSGLSLWVFMMLRAALAS